MRKLANLITAYIYISIMKLATKKSKSEILNGEDIVVFGRDLVFSSFVFMILIMLSFYIAIWGFQSIVTIYQNK